MRFSLCLLALWLAAASRRDAAGFVSAFAPDSDLHPGVWNGVAQPTIETLRATADTFEVAISGLETHPSGEIRAIARGPDAATAEGPITFTITTKSRRRVPWRGVAASLHSKAGGRRKSTHV